MSKLFNEEEQWKDIYFIENDIEYDYRGLYQVSTYGNVKSLGNDRTKKEKMLKKIKDTHGYEIINFCKNGKYKKFYIHRLVAHMFVENDNPIEKIEINHIDENKENNHVSNLEWCTREYNCNYGTRNERTGEAKKGELVAQIEPSTDRIINLKYGREYEKLGFHQSNVSACCRGRYKTSQNYIWKYISDCTDEQINEYIIKNKQINIE